MNSIFTHRDPSYSYNLQQEDNEQDRYPFVMLGEHKQVNILTNEVTDRK